MNQIESHLQPFVGYLELGMYAEARDELKNVPAEWKDHPVVLLARLGLLVEMRKWKEGARLGASFCNSWPDELEFWFKTAYCQHELRQTQEAKNTLLAAPVSIRKTAVFHYNMACYEVQLGNMDAANVFLKTCFEKDRSFHKDALTDPDLKPLWESLGKY